MTKLRAELRESESKNQQLLDEKRELEDKIIALSITIEEYEVLPAQQPPSVPKPLPIRTQVMDSRFMLYVICISLVCFCVGYGDGLSFTSL